MVYPRFTGANGGSQWGFVAAALAEPWTTDIGVGLGIRNAADVCSYRAELVAAVDQEISQCLIANTLVISSEHIHSRLDSVPRVQALVNFLARWSERIEILVYLRRQDRVAVSHYSTKLKSGDPDPRVLPDTGESGLPYYYDYHRLYDTWASVVGEPAIRVRLFDRATLFAGDLIVDFCRQAALSRDGKLRPANVNLSLSAKGAALVREVNRQWPRFELSDRVAARDRLVAMLSRRNPGKFTPLTRGQAEAFYSHCLESNARLAARAFPQRSGPLFTEDFSDYPEALSEQHADVSDIAGQMIAVAKALPAAGNGVSSQLSEGMGRIGGLLARAVAGVQSKLFTRAKVDLRFPPVCLHLGLPKTATTTLQNTLFSEHREIFFLGKNAGMGEQRGCLSPAIQKTLAPIFWRGQPVLSPAETRHQIRAHWLPGDEYKLILGSWEGLAIQPPDQFEKMLKQALYVFGDLRVMFTLRNPYTRLPSAYLQALKACIKLGKHHTLPKGKVYVPFSEWLQGEEVHRTHDTRFDFGRNLRFAQTLLGTEKVGIFLFEDMVSDLDAFITQICHFLQIDPVVAKTIEWGHRNPGLTEKQVGFLMSMDSNEEDRERWLSMPNSARRAAFLKIDMPSVSKKFRVAMTSEDREHIADKTRTLNNWIAQTFELDLARHEYPL